MVGMAALGVALLWLRSARDVPVTSVQIARATIATSSGAPPAPAEGKSVATTPPVAALRAEISTNWKSAAQPGIAAFRDWAERYQAANAADRAQLVAEGIALAQQHRAELAQLIRTDPRAAGPNAR